MKTAYTLLFVCFFSYCSFGQTGVLDKSFGKNGKVVTTLKDSTSLYITKGLVQANNKIIAVGKYESFLYPYNGFFAIRYMPDGSIDSAYGVKGKSLIVVPFAGILYPQTACLQNDGKLLIAGYGIKGLLPQVGTGLIVRLTTKGKLDSSFGINGIIATNDNIGASYSALAVQPDNKIIAVSGIYGGSVIRRLMQNGKPDISFGTNGSVSQNSVIFACIIQADGKIITGGSYGHNPAKFCLNRVQSNGNPDSSFGYVGVVTQIGNYDSYITNVALQSDGKIIALGSTDNYTSNAIVRYNANGKLDSSFATNGISHDYFPGVFGRAQSLLIQNDDKILLGGNAVEVTKGTYALERLSANGFIDSSFGINGETTTDFKEYAGSAIYSIAFQTTGKIVAVGGSADVNYSNTVSLARYYDDVTKKQTIINQDAQTTSLNKISLYPNPAKNILHVYGLSTSGKTKLTVIDFMGNIKLQADANNNSHDLNITSLQAGNYLLKIEMNGEVVTKKFVKE